MQTPTIEEPTWPELLGSNNWDGLLHPLNLRLRHLILHCGDLCQATYDAFNNDKNSKYAGSSRYGKTSFLHKVMFESAAHYQVSGFLYATSVVREPFLEHPTSHEAWDKDSNWIGYIATTTDEVARASGRREIYVVWRGTQRIYEWINVLKAGSESAEELLCPKNWGKDNGSGEDDEKIPKVMHGWLSIYVSSNSNSPFTKLSARAQLQKQIQSLRILYKNEKLSITVTGHSLGASLSILSAFDLVENGVVDIPVAAVVFGSPQVGNRAFVERVQQFPNLKILHIRNKIDVIPLYPGAALGYQNVGIELEIDSRKSPSLKVSPNLGDWHNLQAMLHVVAGWNGSDGEFELKVKRSIALVNKSCEFLKDEYLIPGSWWIEKNKGMILGDDGEWVLVTPADEHQPTPEF